MLHCLSIPAVLAAALCSHRLTLYSRKWYRDTTFDTKHQRPRRYHHDYDYSEDEEQAEYEDWLELTRFAVVEREGEDGEEQFQTRIAPAATTTTTTTTI